jgi:CRP-like cAMP-binding protein
MSDHHDPLLLRRLLELRRFPLLAGAELSELATLAENIVLASYPSGAVIAPPGRIDAVHLILSGQIDAGPQRSGAHEAFGWLEVLARRPLAAPAVAVGETRTLRLAASELGEILEDNFGLLALALRELATRALAAQAAGPPVRRAGAAAPAAAAAAMPGPLGLVERMIVLRQRTPFTSARLEALAILAYESEETTWPVGELVSRAGDPARAAYVILDGDLRATTADRGATLLGPGHVIGVLESLAGLRHDATIAVITPVRALEIASTVIFDVLEDHPDLGLAMLQTFAGELLDARAEALAA